MEEAVPRPRHRVLGGVSLHGGDGAVQLGGPKQRAVLGVLAVHAGHAVPVDLVIDVVWGDTAPARARNTVQVYVSTLRRLLDAAGAGRIRWDDGAYVLETPRADVDALAVEDLAAAARAAAAGGDWDRVLVAARAARSLWRGTPLGDLPVGTALAGLCARFEEERLATMELEAEALLNLGRPAEAIPLLREQREEHPLRERLTALLVLAHYRSGNQAEALTTLRTARAALADELGIDPGPALRQLETAVLQHDPLLDRPAGPPPDLGRTLRRPRTPLVGREEEVTRLVEELRADGGLWTLTGRTGVGKTRLALAVAERAAVHFPDGAAVVPLSGDVGPSTVHHVADALGLDVHRPGCEGRLLRYLAGRRVLLVLDTPGTPVDGDVLASLLDVAPRSALLVTGRAALRLSGERVRPVGPLGVPPSNRLEEVRRSPAATLFASRAAATSPGFAIDEVTAPHVAELCRRLDGLPLALELAAAQVAVRGLPGLVGGLDRAFEVLVDGPQDVPARHRSLRAAMESDEELLDAGARRLLGVLALLPEGGTLAELEALADRSGAEVARSASSLQQRGFVRRDEEGELRISLAPLAVELAERRLGGLPDAEELHRRHARRRLDRLAATAGAIGGWESAAARSVLTWAVDNDLTLAVALCARLERSWVAEERFAEGRALAEQLLVASEGIPAGDRSALHVVAARCAVWMGDPEAAEGHLGAALALDDGDALRAGLILGVQALSQGEIDLAAGIARRLLAIAEDVSTPRWPAAALAGYIATEHDRPDDAMAWFETWLAQAVRGGDDDAAEHARLAIGIAALVQGDPEAAARTAQDVLVRAQRAGHRRLVVAATSVRCWARTASGAWAGQAEDLRTVLESAVQAGSGYDVATALTCAAASLAGRGEAEAAAELVGAAETLDAGGGWVRPIEERRSCGRWLDAARLELSADVWEARRRAGRLLALDDAVARVRAVVDDVLQPS